MASEAHDGLDGSGSEGEASRELTFLRRGILGAMWAVPAAVVLDAVPAFAQGSVAPHTDESHVDTDPPHTDIPPQHLDQTIPSHVDMFVESGPGMPPQHVDYDNPQHVDLPEGVPHVDLDPGHVDTPHVDA